MPCLQSYHRRYSVFFVVGMVMVRHCISGVAVDSELVEHLSTVPRWLLVVLPVPMDVQVVA